MTSKDLEKHTAEIRAAFMKALTAENVVCQVGEQLLEDWKTCHGDNEPVVKFEWFSPEGLTWCYALYDDSFAMPDTKWNGRGEFTLLLTPVSDGEPQFEISEPREIKFFKLEPL